jgi:hypothetical protein
MVPEVVRMMQQAEHPQSLTTGDPAPVVAPVDTDAALREQAVVRLKKKRDFHAHVLVYTLFNAFFVGIWFFTGSEGFFWPIFLILGWGIGLILNGWDVYRRPDFTEAQIRREIHHMR